MPTEFRRITFNTDELIEAIATYDQYASQKLTSGLIVGIDIVEEPIISANVWLRVLGQPKNTSVSIECKDIGAALVMYCLNKNIPIPTGAVRYLKKTGEKLSLFLSMGEAIAGPATILPDFFSYDLQEEAVKAA